MMNFMVGERVGDEYVPMMLEELALDGNDSRAPRWSHEVPAAVREKFHVLVIGAGMSGLLQALRLKEAGIPFTVVEKNDSVGGTWYENSYPGCRVDIATTSIHIPSSRTRGASTSRGATSCSPTSGTSSSATNLRRTSATTPR